MKLLPYIFGIIVLCLAGSAFAQSRHIQAGADLHQPWNLTEFQVRPGQAASPYRLVSDSQPIIQADVPKTPPPAGGLERVLAPSIPPSPQTLPRANPPARTQPITLADRMPILRLGRDLTKEFRPSNDRNWSQNHAVLQTAEFEGNFVTVRNVRFSRYESAEVYTTQYYDATFNLDDIRTIDLIMVPFQGMARIAHVESSFGFADGRQIGCPSKPDTKKAKNTTLPQRE